MQTAFDLLTGRLNYLRVVAVLSVHCAVILYRFIVWPYVFSFFVLFPCLVRSVVVVISRRCWSIARRLWAYLERSILYKFYYYFSRAFRILYGDVNVKISVAHIFLSA